MLFSATYDEQVGLISGMSQWCRIYTTEFTHCEPCLLISSLPLSPPKVMNFAETIIPNALIIQLKREEESLENICQYYVKCNDEEEKYTALANIFGTISIGQTFIFCGTKRSASMLKERLTRDGHAVGLITGELPVEERSQVLKRFKEGDERVLIATNVMARGIDVEQVTVVSVLRI